MTSNELNEILNKTRRTPNISLTPEQVEELIKDLEQKEKQDKILEKLKRPMFYSERKKLGEEFLNWAEENRASKIDLTNIVTWCFCIKLRSWLDEEEN